MFLFFFFFNDPPTTEIYTLSLHDALPICLRARRPLPRARRPPALRRHHGAARPGRAPARLRARSEEHTSELQSPDHLVCRLLLEKKKKSATCTASLPVRIYPCLATWRTIW